MAFDTSNDRVGMLNQRNPEAKFTEGAEKLNVVNKQGVTDLLFANKDEMRKRSEAQLSDLFSNSDNSYGRARAVGMTAEEASKVVNRAFCGK